MAEIIVVNVVASASIGKELMLQDIAFQLEGAEYDQDRFPGPVSYTHLTLPTNREL